MEKKGQVTVFIIVGLLLLMVVSLFLLMQEGVIDTPFSDVPKEAKPVVDYSRQCVQQIAEEGIFLLGMQGGYIEFPKAIEMDPYSTVDIGFRIPHWYYSGSNRMPSRMLMERQLSVYIDKNLDACLDSYSAFLGQLIVEPMSDRTIKVNIYDSTVLVRVEESIRIFPQGTEQIISLEGYSAEVSSELGNTYELAKSIMEKENEENFLEVYTDEMIATSDYLPYEGMMIGCSPQIWQMSEMEEYVKTLVMHNLHFLQFENTRYYESGMPYYDKLYKIKTTSKRYPDTKVNVIYDPRWHMKEFSVSPREGDIVKPISFMLGDLVGACMKLYHHKYTLEYPVVFQIVSQRHPEQPFYFATPVMMRLSQPNRHDEVEPWPEEDADMSQKKFCAMETEVTLFDVDDQGRIFSTPSVQELRQNTLRVFAVDSTVGYPEGAIAGANISYQCIRHKCEMGATGYDLIDGQWDGSMPMLNAEFPDCMGGIVIAEKEGYWKATERMSVSPETDGAQVMVYMNPVRDLKFAVYVIQDHNGIIEERNLLGSEIALISIVNKEKGYEKTLLYPSDSDYYKDLSLIVSDVEYEVDIKLTDREQLVGGAQFTWSPQAGLVAQANMVEFYVYKKDPVIPLSDPQKIYEHYMAGIEASVNYMPVLI